MHNSSTPIVPWHSAQGTNPIFLRMTWPPISPTLEPGTFACRPGVTDQPQMFMTRVFSSIFQQRYINRFLRKQLQNIVFTELYLHNFISKPLHENNHGFIPCKTSSRPKTSCSFSFKSGSQQTKKLKRKTILVLFQHLASGERKTHNMVELLSDTLCYLTHYTSFI